MPSYSLGPSHPTGESQRPKGLLRMADIVAASGLILVLTPMIALVAALSYRPRLPLIQRRRAAGGAGRQHFTVYEFNGGAGPRAHGFSPRSFVRTFRGDQLPQLLNVIRGELSFFAAGSRPRLFAD